MSYFILLGIENRYLITAIALVINWMLVSAIGMFAGCHLDPFHETRADHSRSHPRENDILIASVLFGGTPTLSTTGSTPTAAANPYIMIGAVLSFDAVVACSIAGDILGASSRSNPDGSSDTFGGAPFCEVQIMGG